MSTTVTSKGQVTIPKPVRDRLNIKPGSQVDFELAEDGRVVLVKAGRKTTPKSRFDRILGSATVTWNAPTTNEDGTPLTDLAGFRVLYGTDPNQLTQKLEIPGAQQNSVSVEELQPATYYFAVKAYTASAKESNASPVVWKTIQ